MSTSDTQRELQKFRTDYVKGHLDERDVAADAIEQFGHWFENAKQHQPGEPNVMTLATAAPDGTPHARIVLLKDFGPNGFTFYGNYESQKGTDLAANPRAALCFFWPVLERQVRIEGSVQRTTREEAKAYYDIRPRAARIGAWASSQSRVVGSREELERRNAEFDAKFPGDQVPLPDHWGGWRLTPSLIEFWQGGAARLHDRLRYTRGGTGWKIERLCP